MWVFSGVALIIVGYVASIYLWPAIRIWINGVSGEAAKFRQKAAQLEAKIQRL